MVLVLLTHLWRYPRGAEWLNRLASTGWIGVDLFFVLSGFLITRILWRTRDRAGYYRNFYVRRFLRIVPPYYLVLTVVFVLLPIHGSRPKLVAARAHWPFYVLYLANVILASHGWQLFALDITWSLSVEEQFYLVWPFIVRRATPRRAVALCAALALGALLLRLIALRGLHLGWMWTYMLPVFRADSFAVGALIAILSEEGLLDRARGRRLSRLLLAAVGPLVGALVVSGYFPRNSALVNTLGYSLLALLAGALVMGALHPGRVNRTIFGARWLRYVGKVSYGMYLYHPICLMVTATALAALSHRLADAAERSVPGSAAFLVGTVLVTIAAASVSYALLERPLLGLKRHFTPPARRS